MTASTRLAEFTVATRLADCPAGSPGGRPPRRPRYHRRDPRGGERAGGPRGAPDDPGGREHPALHGHRHAAPGRGHGGRAGQRRGRSRPRLRRHQLHPAGTSERPAPGRGAGRRPRWSRATGPRWPSPTSPASRWPRRSARPSTPRTTSGAGTPRRPSAPSPARPPPPRSSPSTSQTTRTALGIAASLASGLKENFGSMTKPFHAGHAARNGVWAAMLAREGLTSSATALDGPQGYLAAFGGRERPGRSASGTGSALADPRIGDRGQAVPVVRPHPLRHRRADRSARAAPPRSRPDQPGRSRRDPRGPERAHPPAAGHRAGAQVLHGVLRGGGAGRRPGDPGQLRRRPAASGRGEADVQRLDGRRSRLARRPRTARVEQGHRAALRRAHPRGGAARRRRGIRISRCRTRHCAPSSWPAPPASCPATRPRPWPSRSRASKPFRTSAR